MESKNDRFKRLATKRTIDVIEKIRILGNLSVKNNYEYTSDEVNKIFRSIEDQLKQTKARFLMSKKSKTFSL